MSKLCTLWVGLKHWINKHQIFSESNFNKNNKIAKKKKKQHLKVSYTVSKKEQEASLFRWFFSPLIAGLDNKVGSVQNQRSMILLIRSVEKKFQSDIQEITYSYVSNKRRATDSTKINRPGHNIRMYWTKFRLPTAHVQHSIFGKNSYRNLYSTSLRFFWHLLRPNWSIIRATVSL